MSMVVLEMAPPHAVQLGRRCVIARAVHAYFIAVLRERHHVLDFLPVCLVCAVGTLFFTGGPVDRSEALRFPLSLLTFTKCSML